jgi:hypothetical protein
MKIWSYREWEYISDPDGFLNERGDGYARVLKSRIKKKYEAMKGAIESVDVFMVLLTPDAREAHKLECQRVNFKYTYLEAFEKLKEKDNALCQELHKSVDEMSFAEMGEVERYNREITKVQAKVIAIIFGEDELNKFDRLELS